MALLCWGWDWKRNCDDMAMMVVEEVAGQLGNPMSLML
jgi:hypothetical protein